MTKRDENLYSAAGVALSWIQISEQSSHEYIMAGSFDFRLVRNKTYSCFSYFVLHLFK